MADLPDWYTQIQSATLRATSIQGGIDADKPASPAAGDIWLARDTFYLYVCNSARSWEKVTKLYLPLAGGTMTGAIVFAAGQTGTYLLLAGGTMAGAIAMGTNKITGLDAPAANADAARKLDVDTVNAKLDDVTRTTPTRALGTIYQNTDGKIRCVAVTVGDITFDPGGTNVYCDSTTSPTTIVSQFAPDSATTVTFRYTHFFIVPPNWYYYVENRGTKIRWLEWDLF